MSNILTLGDRKYEQEIDESSTKDEDLDLSLSLGPSSSKSSRNAQKANENLNFDLALTAKDNDNEVVTPKKQQFSCNYCDKTFLNPQALGGHQNSHRKERIMSKIEKEFYRSGGIGLGPLPCPYPMVNHPHFGGSSLYGAQMQPMANMYSMAWNNYDLGNGNRGLYNTSYPSNQFGISSNSWVTSSENQQSSNQRNVGVSYENALNQVPSFLRDVAQSSNTTQQDREGLQGNYYTRNH